MTNSIWTEKFRPSTLTGYVFKDAGQKAQIEKWVKTKELPHLLFSGAAGTGKTTLAKILINEVGINAFDVLEINASRENSVDTIRDKITGFVSTIPFGTFKIVLLDEADYISPSGQAALRGVMETYASTARFILTCNYPNKIIPALHSRCQGFHIEKLDQVEYTARVAEILITENIEFDIDTLDLYVRTAYPDLRKCINTVQMNATDGRLLKPSESNNSTADYKLTAIEMFKAGNIKAARELMCSQIRPEEIDDVFRFLYDNLDLWSATEDGQDQAILIIRNGLRNAALVADPEINLSATLIELSLIE